MAGEQILHSFVQDAPQGIPQGNLVALKEFLALRRSQVPQVLNKRYMVRAEALYDALMAEQGKGMMDGTMNAMSGAVEGLPLLGVFACALGKRSQAEQIYEIVKKRFPPKKGSSLLTSSDEYRLHAGANAYFGILEFMLGRPEEAKKVKGDMAREIGRTRAGFWREAPELPANSETNLGIGILECLLTGTKSTKELHMVESRIGFEKDTGLLRYARGTSESDTVGPNFALPRALHAILLWQTGRRTEAMELALAIEAHFGIGSEGLFNSGASTESPTVCTNAAMGILFALFAGVKLREVAHGN